MDILDFYRMNPAFFLFTVTVVSLFIGSFLNVVIYRIPRILERSWDEECRTYLGLKPLTTEKLSLSLPFSHCPHCKKPIKPWHNIPILSYLWLMGRCAYCHAPISLRYPLIEGLTAILSFAVAWRFGLHWQTLAALLFTWISICLTFIDLDFRLLPDQLTLLLLWLGLFFSIFHLFCMPVDAILGGIIGYLIFAITQIAFAWLMKKNGMGQGDLKFLAALGAYLGWQMLPLIILLSSISGIMITVIHMVIKGNYKSTPIPFGPYLAIAGWVALMWGQTILQWYLNNI